MFSRFTGCPSLCDPLQALTHKVDLGTYATNPNQWDLTHFDFWLSYRFKMFGEKVRTKVQLNVRDIFEDGGLVPVFVNWDGNVAGYRIVDSRQVTLSAKFEF